MMESRAHPEETPHRLLMGPVPAQRGAVWPRIDYDRWALLLLAHVPLAVVLNASRWLATAHALTTLAYALVVLSRGRTPQRLLLVLAYIVAAEPLWRATGAMIFWETGKYALAGLSLLAISKYRLPFRCDKTGIFYFAALLPSILVLSQFDREAISFNLSGPLALAAASIFLSAVPVPSKTLSKLFLTMMGPILSLAFIATSGTLTAEQINFYDSKVTSAGLGQNQASSALALGGLLAFLFLYLERKSPRIRWLAGAIGLWCTAQAALTFSRGGIATTVGAACAASFFLLQDRKSRGALVARLLIVVAITAYLLLPLIDSFTGGALMDRFTETSLTGRDKIIEADLIVFRENPILGVGPGQSNQYHALTFRYSAAHTEYSRLLAEHGSFGLLALMLLIKMALQRGLKQGPLPSKALAAAVTVWALLFMAHAAMRLALVSFLFALGGARFFEIQPTQRPIRNAPGAEGGAVRIRR